MMDSFGVFLSDLTSRQKKITYSVNILTDESGCKQGIIPCKAILTVGFVPHSGLVVD